MIEKIKKMDVKSDEFFEIYKLVSEKYWTIENPDSDQRARQGLMMLAERGDTWMVEMQAILASNLLAAGENREASSGVFGIKNSKNENVEVYFKFYNSPEALDRLQKQLTNTVMVKAKKEGVIK